MSDWSFCLLFRDLKLFLLRDMLVLIYGISIEMILRNVPFLPASWILKVSAQKYLEEKII